MSEDILQQIRDRIGIDAVLLPIEKGKKGPFYADWEHLTPDLCASPDTVLKWYRKKKTSEEKEQYREAKYEDELRDVVAQGGNIGVLLRDGLCAIDIDEDSLVEPFLAANPGLRQTLISKGKRGVQIWVKCLPEPRLQRLDLPSFPGLSMLKLRAPDKNPKHALPWGEWRAATEKGAQSVIWGQHPDGNRYQWLTDEPVREIFFSEIRWPEDMLLPWVPDTWLQLVERFGPPWSTEDGQIAVPTEAFWAGRFAALYNVIYETDEDRFYEYDPQDGAWKIRTDEQIRARLADDILAVAREASLADLVYNEAESPFPSWRRLKRGQMSRMGTNLFRSCGRLGAITSLLKGNVGRKGVFKSGTGIIHLRNGMIDLREEKMRLRPFSPSYYSRNPLPLAYSPRARCTVFKTELLEAALDDDNISLLQRFGGLAILGRNVPQKIMILSGTAGGGKSTVVKVIQEVVGRPNIAQLRTEQLTERFELFAYVGKTLLCGVDVPGNFLMQRGAYMLKALTGGDYLQAEVKGSKDYMDLEGHYNMVITCNARLKVRLDADTDAWRRRLCLIRYERPKPEKPRDDFAEWLVEKEGPGILLWLMEGARAILKGDRLTLTEKQRSAVDDLLDESDSVRVYLRKRLVISKGHALLTDDLTEGYFAYCEAVGWDAESKRTVERQLPDLMLEIFRAKQSNSVADAEGKNRKGYRGVAFRPEVTESESKDEKDTPF